MNISLREKAVKGLECCLIDDPAMKACGKCPYECVGDTSCIDILMADALALLTNNDGTEEPGGEWDA